jgi:hypothetical protein
MQRNKLSAVTSYCIHLGKEIEGIPEKDEETNFWMNTVGRDCIKALN